MTASVKARAWLADREALVLLEDVPDSPLWRGRAALHLGIRAMARSAIASPLTELAVPGARWASIALVPLDAAMAHHIDRPTEPRLRWRLALDTLEVAGWGALVRGEGDISPALGSALVCESAVRFGPVAILLPFGELAVAASLRRLTGRKVSLSGWIVPLGGYAAGLMLRRIEVARVQRLRQERHTVLRGARTEAQMVGRWRAVTTPIDDRVSVHDALDRLREVLPSVISVPSVPAWARRYIEETKSLGLPQGAQTLVWTATQWRRDHNSAHMAVAEKVIEDCQMPTDDAQVWLTPSQVVALRHVLDARPPAGAWSLHLVEHGGYATRVVLDINGKRVTLAPAPDELMPRLADPLPAMLMMAAFWSVIDATEIGNRVRLSRALVPAAAFLVSAGLADDMYRRRGDAASLRIATLCTAVAGVQAAVAAFETRRSAYSPGGNRRVPLQHAALAPTLAWSYLAGRGQHRSVSRAACLALAGVAIASIAGQRLPRRPGLAAVRWIANAATAATAFVYGREQTRWDGVVRHLVADDIARIKREVAATACTLEWDRISQVARALLDAVRTPGVADGDRDVLEAKLDVVAGAARRYGSTDAPTVIAPHSSGRG